MDKGAILNQLDTTLYEVIQSFTFQHIVLQQSQINKLTNHFIIAGITNKNSFFFTFQIIPFLIQIIQFVFSEVGISSSFLPFCLSFNSLRCLLTASISDCIGATSAWQALSSSLSTSFINL